MKKESYDILTNLINKVLDDATICQESRKYIVDDIQQLVRCEMPSTSTKFDLWKVVLKKDNTHPAMNGIFHSEGFKVASDAHILAFIKEDYHESYEGKIVSKDGTFIQAIYPKYKSVIPDVSKNGYHAFELDLNKLKNLISIIKSDNKTLKYDSPYESIRICNNVFKIKPLEVAISFMETYKTNTIWINGENKAGYIKSGENGFIIMPVRAYSDSNEIDRSTNSMITKRDWCSYYDYETSEFVPNLTETITKE